MLAFSRIASCTVLTARNEGFQFPVRYCLTSHLTARPNFGRIYEWGCVLNPDFFKNVVVPRYTSRGVLTLFQPQLSMALRWPNSSYSILAAAFGPLIISHIMSEPGGKSVSKQGSPAPLILVRTAWRKCQRRSLSGGQPFFWSNSGLTWVRSYSKGVRVRKRQSCSCPTQSLATKASRFPLPYKAINCHKIVIKKTVHLVGE